MKIYIDGKFYNERDAKISVFDHGLLYGDGLFEGIRAYQGRIFKLKEHIDRLHCSARSILLRLPLTSRELTAAIIATCRQNRLRDAYIRLRDPRIGTGANPTGQAPLSHHYCGEDHPYPAAFYERGWKS